MSMFASRRGFFSTAVAACLAWLGVRPRPTVAAPVLPPAADGTYSVTAMVSDGHTTSSQPFTWQVSPSRRSNAATKET